MSVDEVINTVGGKEQDVQRALSLLLFTAIKPYCVELTQLALLPNPIFKSDSQKLVSALNNVNNTLEEHYRENSSSGPYRLSANIADYVFFPLSNLLKQPTLSDEVISILLKIIAFLINHSWSHNADAKLLDQLYPLILFLVDNNVGAKGVTVIETKEFTFKQSAVTVMSSLISCLPVDYFSSNPKNLTMLGSSTTILLDIFASLQGPTTQEQIFLVNECLDTISLLYSKVSAEQLSHIFPGSVSHLVNFSTNSKSLHFSIICGILKLLRQLIVKVFNDKDLKISLDSSDSQPDLEKLNELWEDQNDEELTHRMDMLNIKIEIPATANKHRTTSWLFATSKQLKISLTILFRTFLSSQSYKLKVQTKTQVSNELISFVNEILQNCFVSLFKDFCAIALDVLSMLISILTSDEKASIQKATDEEIKIDDYASLIISNISANDTSDKNQKLLYNHVKLKLSDFINNKLSSIVFSTDDEKINSYIVSLKFQFSILNKLSNSYFTNEDAVQDLKFKLTQHLQLHFVNCFLFNNQLKSKESFPLAINGTPSDNKNESNNKLDNIELPPHINANKLTRINNNNYLTNRSDNINAYTDNLLILSKNWSGGEPYRDSSELLSNYFKGIYSPFIENRFVGLLSFIALLGSSNESKSLLTVENLFINNDVSVVGDASTQYLDKAVSLWMANNLMSAYNSKGNKQVQNSSNIDSFDINEFLVFEQKETMTDSGIPSENNIEEISYLIMDKAQELIDEVSSLMNSPENITSKNKMQLYKIYEFAYSVAIDSIGQLANHLSLADFQTDFLIDYLYPLLEALTYQSNSLIQTHAVSSLDSIVKNYYNGSLELLLMDNLDYLIDCLSLKLSVVSTLTPALPGILLIVLKIAGIKLLLTNQLLDILTKMFILIDSYHGYSALVQGFFIVFEELIQQIKVEYLKETILHEEESSLSINDSLYKPWGLSNCAQLLALIDDSNRLIDPMNDYDSNTEYFKRKPDTAFGDQLADSDDEDEKISQSDESDQEVWNSCIPKNIYLIVQKIFNYGFRLLSHPSTNLRVQIIKTLINIYPILSENYQLLLPIISQHWPVLLTLVSGSSTLSTFSEIDSYDYASDNIIILGLEFLIEIIEEDKKKGEKFLAKRFIEIWQHLSNNSKISGYIKRSNLNKQSGRVQKQVSTLRDTTAPSALNPKMIQLYVKLIITGLNTYERTVSDLTAYDMVKFCYSMGLSKDQYMVKEIKNILWVIEHEVVL
ncbi:uncharacterized protein AC631_00371 [Debaryomyces fabryi]|uniref:TEL2-interacting protein 1 n=1 Tax=Debaryomyces fabryi TaxID=58627 RepID=A0A0V1Q644_9ASCO|nr:uncharacterized protein AC631_00371 [Debaryomyces fabryi]KSA03916.1 hypothetical protein AC631_00371 [Debaryomyces fabryi]CUM48824.1 unnamed protein product [Debaryomyces fabryi]